MEQSANSEVQLLEAKLKAAKERRCNMIFDSLSPDYNDVIHMSEIVIKIYGQNLTRFLGCSIEVLAPKYNALPPALLPSILFADKTKLYE